MLKKLITSVKSIGPAIIVAAVVCGPGSILTSSKVGAEYGYSMIWFLVLAAILMWGMISLSARLGVGLEKTPCAELAARLGRPVAATIGIILFLIIAVFQSTNNLAILAALEPFLDTTADGSGQLSSGLAALVLVVLNATIIGAVYWFRNLYRPIELLMKSIVLCVVTAFVINVLIASPPILSILRGLLPSIPAGGGALPYRGEGGKVVDDFILLQALLATTLSVAGAFYQAYVVREKGYTVEDLKKQRLDSLVGITVLGGISLIVMCTAASTFFGRVGAGELRSIADVARQFEPLLGSSSRIVFGIAIFAGGFGAFIVNAMIGGNLLSDGLGLGSGISNRWSRHLTTVALLIGMLVAILSTLNGQRPVYLIIFAQALTVLGLPALALALIYLGTRPELTGKRKIPIWNLALAFICFGLTLVLALRTAVRLWLTLS
jgi:Mn2+/Fe2+ NRAMP family transporter